MKEKFLNELSKEVGHNKIIYIFNFAKKDEENLSVLLSIFDELMEQLQSNEVSIYLTLLLQLNPPNILEFMKSHINVIMKYIDQNQMMDLILNIMARDDASKFLSFGCLDKISGFISREQMFQLFFSNLSIRSHLTKYLMYILENQRLNISVDDISTILLAYPDGDIILKKHFNFIFMNTENMLDLKEKLELEEELLNQVNEYIDTHTDTTIEDYINKGFEYIGTTHIDDQHFLSILKTIFEELLVNEKVKLSDTEIILGGSYSCVYKIGNKVLKLGTKRQVFHLQNNKRFLSPLLRKEILVKTKDDKFTTLTIEVTEFVNTHGITEEDTYSIYKELRDEGLIWTDPRTDNMGRLNKKNKIHFEDIDTVSDEMQNYYFNKKEILDEGNLVILDNDYIYPENYSDIKYGNEYYYSLFEKRYQEEKQINHKQQK